MRSQIIKVANFKIILRKIALNLKCILQPIFQIIIDLKIYFQLI